MPEPTPYTREALIDLLIESWGKGTFRSLRQAAGRDVDTLLTALAADPGDLPARMREAVLTFFGHDGVGRTDTTVKWAEAIAAAALSVRWEHAAHLAARVGDAERRAEHAESEHQVTQERLAETRTKLDRVIQDRTQAQLDRNAAKVERDGLRQHILDIDAHATPYGDIPEDPGYVGTYLVTAGALHRALGKIGHTAPKCQAEAERDALKARLDQLRAYARWCNDRSVEPEARDIRELADGTHHDDYVALMAAADRTDGGG